MAYSMVQSEVSDAPDLHVHATKSEDSLYVMVMNESRTTSYPAEVDIDGFDVADTGSEITLSSREYFWNTIAGEADWKQNPAIKPLPMQNEMTFNIPPYCVKVLHVKIGSTETPKNKIAEGKPELRILLPDDGYGDMNEEGWVRAFIKGSHRPCWRMN